MKFLLINLAAPQENTLLTKTAEAKRTKLKLAAEKGGAEFDAGNVRTENPHELVKEFLDGKLQASDERLKSLQSGCKWADKILIATHGSRVPESCYIDVPKLVPDLADEGKFKLESIREVLMSVAKFGEFILKCLPEDAGPYKLVLVMCWGARGIPTDLNYDGALGAEAVKSSFAFKFFASICVQRKIQMSAWTGMMNFDVSTGHAVIEDESSMEARRNQLNLTRDDKRALTSAAYRTLAATDSSKALDSKLKLALRDAMAKKTRNLETFAPSAHMSPEEKVVAEEYQWKYRIELEKWKVTDCVTPKSGKFIYTYEDGKVKVRRRYPRLSEGKLGDTVSPEFLYEGPLV